MNFWEQVYDLRSNCLIPRKWNRSHLRRHLEKPHGQFEPTTITTVPSNQSLTRDGRTLGDYVRRGQPPRAWRAGRDVFELIVDPEDDEKTQAAEHAIARRLAASVQPRRTLSQASYTNVRSRGSEAHGGRSPGAEWYRKLSEQRMETVLKRLKEVEPALEAYAYLQRSLSTCNVFANREFRTAFNGYYRMRQKPAAWYDGFFSILEREKHNQAVSFGSVLEEIYCETKRVEASFSSKLVATINANLPVWDRHVLDNLGLTAPPSGRDSAWRLRRCVESYSRIRDWTTTAIQQDAFEEWSQRFDAAFPQFRGFTAIKKLDLLLWQSR